MPPSARSCIFCPGHPFGMLPEQESLFAPEVMFLSGLKMVCTESQVFFSQQKKVTTSGSPGEMAHLPLENSVAGACGLHCSAMLPGSAFQLGLFILSALFQETGAGTEHRDRRIMVPHIR